MDPVRILFVDDETLVLNALRRALRNDGHLVFFTDARSAKVQQCNGRPEGMLVMWSQRLGWQLRLRVALSIETSGLAVSSRWARLKLSPAAQDYLSPQSPGLALAPPDVEVPPAAAAPAPATAPADPVVKLPDGTMQPLSRVVCDTILSEPPVVCTGVDHCVPRSALSARLKSSMASLVWPRRA